MFINSLFLSKLLNLKTDSQPSNEVGKGFNYLFSEIIKVKTSQIDSVFIPENIGGTLLDHKTIFIANSSPLDKVKVSKVGNEINQIENLYKLFSKPHNKAETGNGQINLSLNKIISDKSQFVKSIENLIKNILNSKFDKQIDNIEIKYVSKNLIQTAKLNKKNSDQFTKFLAQVIDNNSSFSFVIGANAKQILFDVECISPNTTNYQSLNTNIEQSHTQESIPGISSNSDEGTQSDKHLTNQTFEKIPAMNDEKSFERNIKAENTLEELFQPDEKLFHNSDRISDDNINTDSKKIIDLKPEFEKAATKLNLVITDGKESTYKYYKEYNIDLKAPENSVKTNPAEQIEKENNSPVKIEFNDELKNEKSASNNNSLELKELKDKNLGEVKIIIKSKPNEYHYQRHIGAELKTDDKVKIDITSVSQKRNESSLKRVPLTALQSDKNITSIKKSFNNNIEKDLPEFIAASVTKPRIGRAGLTLIADYQNWDLVFGRTKNSSINQEQIKINLREDKKNVTWQKIDEQDRAIVVEQKKPNSMITTNKQNEDVRENLNSEKETSKLAQKGNNTTKINDLNVKSEMNAKVVNLELSGKKKIKSISNSHSDDSRKIIELKENTNDISKMNSKNEFTQQNKFSMSANKQDSSSNNTLDNFKSDLQQKVNSESSLTKNDSSEHYDKSNFKETNEHFQQSNDKNIVDKPTGKDIEFIKEFQNVNRQEFIPAGRTNLLNNKSLVNHFSKNPIESRTLEKFIQILDRQEVVQSSEIVNYSKLNHSVEIKLSPEELGKIKILLDTNDNNVSAKIEVNSEQTKIIVVNNLPQLKETLTQQGVNLNNVNVTVTSEEHKGSNQTKQKSRKKLQEGNTNIENTDEKITVRHLGYNTYEYLA